MNPFAIIWAAAALVAGVGFMTIIDPEVDTWGIVPAFTAYPSVEAGTVPDAPTAHYSPETTLPPYQGPGCAEWADTALRAGFDYDQLPTALQVMELESMCLPGAIGDNGQSFGLMQINDFWCTPSKYWPRGYLQTQGMLDDCVQLLDPLTNLMIAAHIATHHGWENWTTYDR